MHDARRHRPHNKLCAQQCMAEGLVSLMSHTLLCRPPILLLKWGASCPISAQRCHPRCTMIGTSCILTHASHYSSVYLFKVLHTSV